MEIAIVIITAVSWRATSRITMHDKQRQYEKKNKDTVASQREGSRFDPHLGPFCVEFACSPRVCVGSLRVLRLPPTVQKTCVLV